MRFLNLPGAPLLLDRVGGRADPAAALRTICTNTVAEVLTDDIDRVIILAPGDRDASWSPELSYPSRRLIGGRSAGGGSPALPLPLAVGRHLIGDRAVGRELIMRTVATDRESDLIPGPVSDDDLVVGVADGSALGRPGGPDVVHPSADAYDRNVSDAWRSGDPADLAALDADLGAAVMATGAPVWRRLAQLAEGRSYQSKINYADATFGTFYLVACWR